MREKTKLEVATAIIKQLTINKNTFLNFMLLEIYIFKAASMKKCLNGLSEQVEHDWQRNN